MFSADPWAFFFWWRGVYMHGPLRAKGTRAQRRTTGETSASSLTVAMEAAICTLVTEFKSYAGNDGHLSKQEFQNLVTSQLPTYVKVGSGQPRSVIGWCDLPV